MTTTNLECLDDPDGDTCRGTVAYRSHDGLRAWPRCVKHFDQRCEREQEINERYPPLPPSDWSPLDAGESWDDDY